MAMERDGVPVGTAKETHMLVNATGDTNHNKFWKCTYYDSGDVEIEFGRIGKTSTKGVHRGVGHSWMINKMDSKKRGKRNKKTGQYEPYTEIDVMDGTGVKTGGGVKTVAKRELATIATKQIEHSSPQTAKLIKWLADVNRHNIHKATGGQVTWDASKGVYTTPLGIVPPSSISEARTLLNSIADHVANANDRKHRDYRNWTDRTFVKNVERYLTIIPHDLGMRWSPQNFVPNVSAVQKENGVLDALDASYVTATTVKTDGKKAPKKADPKLFETKLTIVEDGKVIDRIKKKYRSSLNRNHYRTYNMKLVKVWQVEVGEMSRAFDNYGRKLGNIKELWHGSVCSNLLSILKVGLIIPPANSSHCTGRYFGNGIYASDQSSKALNYATSFWGQKDIGRYFMFLVDFAMGREYIPPRGGVCNCPPGYNSMFAKAGRSGVQNNEMIVYKTSQANLKFLCEFS